MKFSETKERLIEALYSRGIYFRRVHEGEYQTRCPFCGDSIHSLNTGHFYLHIEVDSPYNIPYYCFKCQKSGIIDVDTLDLMGITDQDVVNGIRILNKNGKTKKAHDKENKFMFFDRVIPTSQRYPKKITYIESRLGIKIPEEDLEKMKIVTSLYDFLLANNIKSSPFKKEIREMLEKDYIGFLSSGNSHILFRDVTEKHEYPWIKYPIDEESQKNRVFYSFSNPVDIFTEDEIVINMSEGVMDALGIAYHFDHGTENVFNIAVCGQNYNTNIKHFISMGVFGSNVTLNIYLDNDEKFNKNAKKKLNLDYLQKYKPLFNEINTFVNLKSKDCGVEKEKIILKKKRI